MFVCLFVFLQRTARNCSKLHAARAAQFSVLARPIKFLITGVVLSDPLSMLLNTHSYHICYITVRMLTKDTCLLTSWCSYLRVFFFFLMRSVKLDKRKLFQQLFTVAATIYYYYPLFSCHFLMLQLRLNRFLIFPLVEQSLPHSTLKKENKKKLPGRHIETKPFQVLMWLLQVVVDQ